jgi:hypothetical protein
MDNDKEEFVHLLTSAEQTALLASFKSAAEEAAARVRSLEEVKVAIEDRVKELSCEQVAVDLSGRRLMAAERHAIGTCSPSSRISRPRNRPHAFACCRPCEPWARTTEEAMAREDVREWEFAARNDTQPCTRLPRRRIRACSKPGRR